MTDEERCRLLDEALGWEPKESHSARLLMLSNLSRHLPEKDPLTQDSGASDVERLAAEVGQ
jgi:hypothetical protein